MKITVFLLIILFSVTYCLAEDSDTGKLSDMEQELNTSDADNDHDENDNDECELEDGNFFLELFRTLTYYLFIGVPFEDEARQDFLWGFSFNEYPYSPDSHGAYDVYGEKTFRLNLSTVYIHFNEDLQGNSLQGNLNFTPFFKLEGELIRLKEDLQNSTDQMDIYDIYLDYIRFRDENIVWWWGLGAKIIQREHTHTAFSITTGWEFYPFKPMSVNVSMNSAFFHSKLATEIDCNLRLYIYNFYLQTGYLRESVGSESIQGISAGLGVNF
ncbi:hypothetical protein ACFLYK_00430 [Candidatus Cloacimonadota bacterium]